MSKKSKRPNRANRANRQKDGAVGLPQEPQSIFPPSMGGSFGGIGVKPASLKPAVLKGPSDEEFAAKFCSLFEEPCDELADRFAEKLNHLNESGLDDYAAFIEHKVAPEFDGQLGEKFYGPVCAMLWDRFVERVLTKIPDKLAVALAMMETPLDTMSFSEPLDEAASRKVMAAHLARRAARAKGLTRLTRERDLARYVRGCADPALRAELLDVVVETAAPLIPPDTFELPYPIRFWLAERERDWFENNFLKATGLSKARLFESLYTKLMRLVSFRPSVSILNLRFAKMCCAFDLLEQELNRMRKLFTQTPKKTSASIEAEFVELYARRRDGKRLVAQLERMVELNLARPRHHDALDTLRGNVHGVEAWQLYVGSLPLHLSPIDICDNYLRDGLLGELFEYLRRTRNLDLILHYEPDLREEFGADLIDLLFSFVDANEYSRLPTEIEDPYGRPLMAFEESVDAAFPPADIFSGENAPVYLRREPDPRSDAARWARILHYMMSADPGYAQAAKVKATELRHKYARRKEFAAAWKRCGLWG